MIDLYKVTKIYDGKTIALNDVSFHIQEGTIAGVIGRNGSGKTTMFKVISGVLKDYSGSCTLDGHPASLDYSEMLSYLPEVRGLDGRKQVMEHLTDMVCYKGLKRSTAQQAVLEWLERFKLLYAKYHRIDTLSKGNQQKLQFIIAVASSPRLLILDEPFSGLDPITCDMFWEVIEDLRGQGCTIIFSSHNLNERMMCCDQFIFIRDGKVIENGRLADIQPKYEMILEIKNDSLRKDMLERLLPGVKYSCIQDTYCIKVKGADMARLLFDSLENKYSEIFYLRKMNLDELFREINTGGGTDEDSQS